MKRLIPFFLLLVSLPLLAQNSARMVSGVNQQFGNTYPFVPQDATRLTAFSNASPIAATLASGLTAGFGVGTVFSVQNVGAGTLTISCQGCFIYSNGASGSATLALAGGQGADIWSAGQNYFALVGGNNGGGGGGCVVNPSDSGCALYGTPSIDLFIRSQGGGGTDWLFQLLATALNLKVPINIVAGSNAGVISLGCAPDPGLGSGIALVGPATCTPYNFYWPQTAGSGFLRGSATGNKVTNVFQNSIDLSADVGTSICPLVNGCTGSASGSGAMLNIFPPIIRNGDIICAAGSIWTTCPNTGGNSGTPAFLTENSGGTVGWVQVPIPPIDGGTGLTTMNLNTIYKGNTTSGMLPTAMVEASGTLTISEPIVVTSCTGCSPTTKLVQSTRLTGSATTYTYPTAYSATPACVCSGEGGSCNISSVSTTACVLNVTVANNDVIVSGTP